MLIPPEGPEGPIHPPPTPFRKDSIFYFGQIQIYGAKIQMYVDKIQIYSAKTQICGAKIQIFDPKFKYLNFRTICTYVHRYIYVCTHMYTLTHLLFFCMYIQVNTAGHILDDQKIHFVCKRDFESRELVLSDARVNSFLLAIFI